ncbi:hypothetical protein AX761_24305 [Rhizobium sp. 58]|nr:hypothetical protein AX761_24305 [Rhizobium sp. 58]
MMAIQKHSDFLKRENLPIALSASELGIPSGTGGPVAVQGYDFASGFRFSILNEMRAKIAPMQVVSYDEHDGLGGRFTILCGALHKMVYAERMIMRSLWRP